MFMSSFDCSGPREAGNASWVYEPCPGVNLLFYVKKSVRWPMLATPLSMAPRFRPVALRPRLSAGLPTKCSKAICRRNRSRIQARQTPSEDCGGLRPLRFILLRSCWRAPPGYDARHRSGRRQGFWSSWLLLICRRTSAEGLGASSSAMARW